MTRAFYWVIDMGLLLATVFVLGLLLGGCAHAAILCSPQAGSGSGWAWRQVDGKRCWYHGSRKTAKTRLTWTRSDSHGVDPTQVDDGVVIERRFYKPEELREPTFEERWRGERVR